MTTISPATIDKITELGRAANPDVQLPNGKKGLVIPEEYQLVQVAPHDPILPVNIQQVVTVHDEASFLKYLDRFKNDKTQIFAAPGFLAGGTPYFHGLIDYHTPNTPQRNAHAVQYTPRYSDEWKLWMNTGPMNQEGFAEFIEENRQDIKAPPAAELLDLVRNFKASRKINYDKTFTEKDGTVKLTYEDETEAKGEIIVPDLLTVGIPVYFNGTGYEVDLWVRYRVQGGAVVFTLKPDRADVIEKHAFDQMSLRIAEATGVEVYLGSAQFPTIRDH